MELCELNAKVKSCQKGFTDSVMTQPHVLLCSSSNPVGLAPQCNCSDAT